MKRKYYIHLLFFVYSFIYISLLLFCLFSAVHGIQKFNLKLSTLIAFVMSFHANKMWLFYSKLEVNMVFPCAGSSTFPLISSFGIYYFSDDCPLDNDGDEKEKQDKYSVDKDDHDNEDSGEGQEDQEPPQKKPSHHWRKTKPPAHDITFY